MDDLRAQLAEAQRRVSDLHAEIERVRIETARARLRAQQGEPGAMLYYAIGEAVRAARLRGRLTQAILAEAVNVSRTSIVNTEQGRQRLPIDLLYDIADILGIQAVDLLPRNEDV
jgi:DNA-binding XRE family transcriptional regulator